MERSKEGVCFNWVIFVILYLWNWVRCKLPQKRGNKTRNRSYKKKALRVLNNMFLKGLWRLKFKSTKFKNISSVFPYFQRFCRWALKKGRNEKLGSTFGFSLLHGVFVRKRFLIIFLDNYKKRKFWASSELGPVFGYIQIFSTLRVVYFSSHRTHTDKYLAHFLFLLV